MELKLTDFDKVIILLYLLIGVPILYMEYMKYSERVDCVNWCQKEFVEAGCDVEFSDLIVPDVTLPKEWNLST